MGVLAGLGRVFGKRQSSNGMAAAAQASRSTGVPRVSDVAPEEPVGIDLHTPEPDPEAEREKQLSRKEVIAELQKNYNEVLQLIRKVDQHLDKQEERSRELMLLADRTAKAVESLPAIREQGDELNRAVTDLAKAAAEHHAGVREGQERIASTVLDQTGTLGKQTEVIGTLHDSVRDSVGGMTQATGRLGEAIATMRDADREREAQLSGLLNRAQKSMMAIVIACAVVSVGTLALVVYTILGG